MAGAVAVCDFRARRRQDHLARLAAVQPVAQRPLWKAISISGRFTLSSRVHAEPLDQQRDARPVLSLCRHVTEKNTQTGTGNSAWTCGRFSPGTVISTATNACKFSRRWNPPCRTIAASNATGRRSGRSGARSTIQNRRRQPVAVVESLPPRDRAGRKKILAPVRPFPVSI